VADQARELDRLEWFLRRGAVPLDVRRPAANDVDSVVDYAKSYDSVYVVGWIQCVHHL